MPLSYSAMTECDDAVAFYDRMAPRYDAALTSSRNDRLVRRAFVSLVASHVAAGATLLDFGCGTGLDALDYAGRGYRVLAYDKSEGMLAELARRCAPEIAEGRIIPGGHGSDLLKELDGWPRPHAVVANFGVLNMVRDLRELFELVGDRMDPPGWLIASVINPIGREELARAWWWRSAAKAGWSRSFEYRTDQFTSYLHFARSIRRAAPQFTLVGRGTAGTFARYDGVRSGAPSHLFWEDADTGPGSLTRALWRTPASRFLGTFMFIVMRRDR
jgi:SAM-dependent methyltransferase